VKYWMDQDFNSFMIKWARQYRFLPMKTFLHISDSKFLLIICNLTVSMGTINGLIFYANIVRVNNANFFLKTLGLKVFQQVLAVFIAWLNLEVGIETCFFTWRGCLHSDMAAVCLLILYLDDNWCHHLLK